LKKRGLKDVRLLVSDKCLELAEALGECFPEEAWQCHHLYQALPWCLNDFHSSMKEKIKNKHLLGYC
jgi:transposase-like protein